MKDTINAPDPEKLAELHLAEFFNVQVPHTISPSIRRRLFTVAARVNAEKVFDNPEIAGLLEQVGAIVPKKLGDEIECRGVLWEKGNRICNMCGIRESCRATVVNMDLQAIKISPRLLGRNAVRTKFVINPTEEAVDGRELRVVAVCERDEELLEYLNEHFRAVLKDNEIFYQIPEMRSMTRNSSKGSTLYQFCVGRPDKIMELRICAPSEKLKSSLKCKSIRSGGRASVWVLPDDATTDSAISLINEHVSEIVRKL
jgi:hypothetical protein